MVLARPAVTEPGEVVLPAGTVLAQEMLYRLSRLDLKYISVESTPALTVKKRRTSEAHAEQELEERFSRAQASPLLSRIKETLKSELKSCCKRNASSG